VPRLIQRFCVLDGGQEYKPFIGRCLTKAHRHISRERYQQLLGSGQYAQVWGTMLVRGEEKPVELPAIERVGQLIWRKRMSRGKGPPVAVMQLVP
jgi:hypothetical protein